MGELTAEESAAVVAAMLELTEQGNHEGAESLAQLASDPEQLRQAMNIDDDSSSN